MVHLLDDTDVRGLVDLGHALEVVEMAFRKIGLEEATNSPRSRAQTDHAHIYGMVAGAKGLQSLGLKIRTTSRKGHPEHLVLLFHSKTGEFACLLQGEQIEQVRGGAAGGVAIRHLARADSTRVGILGSGKQARMQLRFAKKVRPIAAATVYSPRGEHARDFATQMGAELDLKIEVADQPAQAVKGHDIVVVATNSAEPVLMADWIEPGMHINAMGSTFLGKTEVDCEVFKKVDLTVVDHRESARLEAGDLVEPLEKGFIVWREIRDLGPLLVGRYEGRTLPSQVTLFKGVGLGLQDVTLGQALFEKAKAQGVGKTIPWGAIETP